MLRAIGVAVVVVLAAAQTLWAGDWSVGLRGGPSIPRLRGGGNEVSRGYASILAPNSGLVAARHLSDRLAVVVEADYSGQGGQREGMQPITEMPAGVFPDGMLPPGTYLYADFDNKSVLTYLEVPLTARYALRSTRKWRCFVEGGPYAGFLLAAEQRTRGTAQLYADAGGTQASLGGSPLPELSLDANTDVKDDLNGMNWGLVAGAGVAYSVGASARMYFNVRGQYGVVALQKDKLDGQSNTGCALFLLGFEQDLGG
jgi:hypothetical protein